MPLPEGVSCYAWLTALLSRYLMEALPGEFGLWSYPSLWLFSDDQCPSFDTDYCFMASLLFVFYMQFRCALRMSK